MKRLGIGLFAVIACLGVVALLGWAAAMNALHNSRDVPSNANMIGLQLDAKQLPPGKQIYWLGPGSRMTTGSTLNDHSAPTWEVVQQFYYWDNTQASVSIATELYGHPGDFSGHVSGVKVGAWKRPHGEVVVVYAAPEDNTAELRASIGRDLVAYSPN
jgi:hypothetical protein